jgi:ribosomal protein S8
MESGAYLNLLAQLKINIAKKNLFFKISISKHEIQMLRLLTQKGIVRRFFKLHPTTVNRELYLVYPNHTLLSDSNLRLVIFNKNADHLTITLNALKIINLASGASSYILKTDKGLLTHQDAIKHKVGGVLLCLIN